jgi:hypothetical protein
MRTVAGEGPRFLWFGDNELRLDDWVKTPLRECPSIRPCLESTRTYWLSLSESPTDRVEIPTKKTAPTVPPGLRFLLSQAQRVTARRSFGPVVTAQFIVAEQQ